MKAETSNEPNNWVCCWQNLMWERKTQDLAFGEGLLNYAASHLFRKRKVRPGDRLFIVTVRDGALYLGGTLQVDSIVDQACASKALGKPISELWPAPEYAIARQPAEQFRPRLCVPDATVRGLKMRHHHHGISAPKRDRSGNIDRQTFRVLRELVPGAEEALLRLL